MRVDRDVFDPDGSLYSHDTRYFISSIDPGTVTPDDLLRLVRGHWQVENCLHWMKDRWWDVLCSTYVKWANGVESTGKFPLNLPRFCENVP